MANVLAATKTLVNTPTADFRSIPENAVYVSSGVPGLKKRLESIKGELDISYREISRRAGLDPSHLGAILRTEDCKVSTLIKIAEVGGVHIGWLVTGTGQRRLDGSGVAPVESETRATRK